MASIPVVISGYGKMGREVFSAICRDEETTPVGVLGRSPSEGRIRLPDGSREVPYSTDQSDFLSSLRPQVVVDFTNASHTPSVAEAALAAGCHLVIGTSGLSEDLLQKLDADFRAKGLGVVVAPNFAIGAVVMMHLAAVAASHFDFAEIVEMHHEQKVDAPSGTAIATARAMAEARGGTFDYRPALQETLPGTRGNEVHGVGIHSVRMPGLVAHQEIVFGAAGQTLTIRHDTTGRECYMPGVLLAIKEVANRAGLTHGLDKLLGLS
jgi:4-hydroxy-tetrahydrodipicolinate reductase